MPMLPRSFVSASLALVLVAAAPHPSAEAAGRGKIDKLVRRATLNTKAFMQGLFIDGPRHSWHAIKMKPVRYGSMLVGIGLMGAGAEAAGIDPEPWALGLSAATTAWAVWKVWPDVRQRRGSALMRSLGAHVIWPSALAAGSSVIGMQVGKGPQPTHLGLGELARTGAQSTVIGIDVPTVVQTVLDREPADGAQH